MKSVNVQKLTNQIPTQMKKIKCVHLLEIDKYIIIQDHGM